MTDLTPPLNAPPPPDQEPIDFILRMVWSGIDSRDVKIQQREVVYGTPPPGFKPWRASTIFPYTVPHPRNPAVQVPRQKECVVEMDAEDAVDAFKKAMPLLMKVMEEFVQNEEKEGFASLIKSNAMKGASLMGGPIPRRE